MATVFLALGSNQGDRLAQIRYAITALQAIATITRSSSVYETAAAYVEDQPPFLNAVIEATTNYAPEALLHELKRIEYEAGRRAGIRYGPRPLDLDIVLYDDCVIDSPSLTIPHPRMHERPFVLRPLAEIAPHRVVADVLAQAEQGQILAIIAPPEALLNQHPR